MTARRVLPGVAGLLAAAGCGDVAPDAVGRSVGPEVVPGVEVLLGDSAHLVRGRRIGLITNRTGITRSGRSSIDVLHEWPGARLVTLFAPEHGIRGTVGEGVPVADDRDPATGLPIRSLYGDTRRPTPAMLDELDVLLFDLQEVGARYFTYVSTMTYAMEATAEAGIPFVVLDRPNPIGGVLVQGPVLDPAFATFVGLHPVPVRHGMTTGELARLYDERRGIGARLHVVPARGWRRDMWYDETGLPWVPLSRNMPSLESATHYPGTCLFEGTSLSVGRGTDAPFQQVGAPWLDGEELAGRLAAYGLPGVRFDPVSFVPESPSDGKHPGARSFGVRFRATDRSVYDPVRAGVAALLEARALSGDRWEWNEAHFDRLAGSDRLRRAIERGASLEEIAAGWEDDLATFRRLRERFLLYP